jgi:hypothetical protein
MMVSSLAQVAAHPRCVLSALHQCNQANHQSADTNEQISLLTLTAMIYTLSREMDAVLSRRAIYITLHNMHACA